MCATLHVVLTEAAEDGLLPANPAAGLARKLRLSAKVKARQEAAKKKAMTRDERDAFLAAAERGEPWWAPAWTVQALTGLRPGELYGLEEADVDLARRSLRVERTLSEDGQRVDIPKGGIGRDVDLSNEAVRVLRAHLLHRRAEKLRRRWRELPRPLFCSTAGTYADPSGVREAFRRVCVEAKLVETRPGTEREQPKMSPRFTPHGLRHTYAALHLQHGTDVYYVSQQLGHASIELTVSTYGAWLKPNRRAAVDALDRAPAIPAGAQA
jgi:integrase